MAKDITVCLTQGEKEILSVKNRKSIYKEYLEKNLEKAKRYLNFIESVEKLYQNLSKKNPFNSTKEERLFEDLDSHAGKRLVYDTYSRTNPEMAQKYLEQLAKGEIIGYIRWDDAKKKFKV